MKLNKLAGMTEQKSGVVVPENGGRQQMLFLDVADASGKSPNSSVKFSRTEKHAALSFTGTVDAAELAKKLRALADWVETAVAMGKDLKY